MRGASGQVKFIKRHPSGCLLIYNKYYGLMCPLKAAVAKLARPQRLSKLMLAMAGGYTRLLKIKVQLNMLAWWNWYTRVP